MENLLGGSYCF